MRDGFWVSRIGGVLFVFAVTTWVIAKPEHWKWLFQP